MTQLELPLWPKFTLAAFLDACAKFEIAIGHKPLRVSLTRKHFDELVSSVSPGLTIDARWRDGRLYSVLNEIEIEIIEESVQFAVTINRTPPPRQPDYWNTGARIS